MDLLLSSNRYKLVARCAGGHNAGHTLVVDGKKYDFHILRKSSQSDMARDAPS